MEMSAPTDEFFSGVLFAVEYVEKIGRVVRKENPPGTEYATAVCDGVAIELTDWVARAKAKADE